MFKRLAAVFGLAVLIVVLTGGAASAHNSFDSSAPADGAALTQSPTELSFKFTKDVELDTLTVWVQGSHGTSTKLTSPQFGPSGTTEAVYDLAPTLKPGKTIVRWKLVGADGHAVAGTITFTITGEAPAATAAAATPAVPESNGEPWVAPSALRWLFRYGSYLAMLVVAGIVLTDEFVWRGADLTCLHQRLNA